MRVGHPAASKEYIVVGGIGYRFGRRLDHGLVQGHGTPEDLAGWQKVNALFEKNFEDKDDGEFGGGRGVKNGPRDGIIVPGRAQKIPRGV
jgi:hypothetical protein